MREINDVIKNATPEQLDQCVAEVMGVKHRCEEIISFRNGLRSSELDRGNHKVSKVVVFSPSTDWAAFGRAWDWCEEKIGIEVKEFSTKILDPITGKRCKQLEMVFWGKRDHNDIEILWGYGEDLKEAFCDVFVKYASAVGKITENRIKEICGGLTDERA